MIFAEWVCCCLEKRPHWAIRYSLVEKNDDTNEGTVINVVELLDLEFSSGEKLFNIPSQYLRRIHKFASETYVLHGKWIGQIQDVSELLLVQGE